MSFGSIGRSSDIQMLETKRRAERRPAEAETLHETIGILVVLKVSIGKRQVTPAEGSGQSGHCLPGQIR